MRAICPGDVIDGQPLMLEAMSLRLTRYVNSQVGPDADLPLLADPVIEELGGFEREPGGRERELISPFVRRRAGHPFQERGVHPTAELRVTANG